MQQITKAHINSVQIPKAFMELLKVEENDYICWKINEQKNEVKISCIKKEDNPKIKKDTYYHESGNIILYRNLYPQGAATFPVMVRKYLDYHKSDMLKWMTNEDDEVIIEKIEKLKFIDISGIINNGSDEDV